MNSTVLIVSDKFDTHADRVELKMHERKLKTIRINLDVESLMRSKISFNGKEWFMENDFYKFSSNDFSSVFLRRPYVELMLDEYNNNDPGFKIWKGEWNKVLLGFYTWIKNKKWLNYLKDAQIADNKFHQYTMAKCCGLSHPQQLVSNSINEITTFIKEHKNCVVKTLAQEFYRDGDGTFKGIYVNKVTLEDFKEFGKNENPITIQKYCEKKFEVRYTVVGKKHFVCKIESQKSSIANIDWRRYDIANTPHTKIEPPDIIKKQVDKLLECLNLSYGALDFVVTPEDEWIFLEVNPLGQWLWIEDLTGLDISGEIANFFTNK